MGENVQKVSSKFVTFTKRLFSSEAQLLRMQERGCQKWSQESRCGRFAPEADGELSLRTVVRGRVHSGLGLKSRESRSPPWASPPADAVRSGVRGGAGHPETHGVSSGARRILWRVTARWPRAQGGPCRVDPAGGSDCASRPEDVPPCRPAWAREKRRVTPVSAPLAVGWW